MLPEQTFERCGRGARGGSVPTWPTGGRPQRRVSSSANDDDPSASMSVDHLPLRFIRWLRLGVGNGLFPTGLERPSPDWKGRGRSSIRKRDKRQYQVRVRHLATSPCRRGRLPSSSSCSCSWRSLGDYFEEPATTLGEEIDSFLAGRPPAASLRPRSVERCAKTWRPLRSTPCLQLRRSEIEDHLMRPAIGRRPANRRDRDEERW